MTACALLILTTGGSMDLMANAASPQGARRRDATAAREPVSFNVKVSRPESHLFEVTMRIPATMGATAKDQPLQLVMPAWIPGSYFIRNYARHVRDLAVTDAAGRPLAVTKVDKSRWLVEGAGVSRGPLTVAYRVYAWDPSVRGAHMDATHAYGNGPALFLYVEGRKDVPQELRFTLPPGWKVSIALPEDAGVYRAADYDELVDSPFECGTHRVFSFTARGVTHTLAIWGHGNEEPERLLRDLARIVEASADLFGGALPYERYLFLIHLAGGSRGGLEHRASQSVGIVPFRFRPEKSYRDVLRLFTHELFHAWNVKRIRPEALGPFDYTREVHTRDLWAMEGVTSYYENVLLCRAGLLTVEQALEGWAKEIQGHRERPGSSLQSPEMASFDSWIRQYQPDENSPNVSEDYYRSGLILGLALDLLLRGRTGGAHTLDDVMRSLWTDFGSKGRGYPEGTIRRLVSRILGAEGERFFDRHVAGAEPVDLETLLRAAGLSLREKAEKDDDESSTNDKGSGGSKADKPVKTKADFGWKTKSENGKLIVSEALEGRAAHEAGISGNDELVALDGYRADADQIKRIERDAAPGSTVRVTVFRREQLVDIPVTLGSRRGFTYEIRPLADVSPEARALLESWLMLPFPKPGS